MVTSSLTEQLYTVSAKVASEDFVKKLQTFCHNFLDKPYRLLQDCHLPEFEAISDISKFKTDDEFYYTFDSFDCVTFVETVLALSITPYNKTSSDFIRDFEAHLKAIRYSDKQQTFLNRNYFISADWIQNNQDLVQDITHQFQMSTEQAKTQIDMIGFLKKSRCMKQFLNHSSDYIKEKLQALGPKVNPKPAVIPFLPLKEVLDNYESFVHNFPTCGIVVIVRPNWDKRDLIGTHLNESHLGIVIKESDDLIFYHATSIEPLKVVNLSLYQYLKRYIDHPTIRGISVLSIQEGRTCGR